MVVVLTITAILIGVLGKHFNHDTVSNDCHYNYFKFDGLTKEECEKDRTNQKYSALADSRRQKRSKDNPTSRFYCARVEVDSGDGIKSHVACLPTKKDEFGREIIPFTGEFADEFNSHPTYEECHENKFTDLSTCAADVDSIATYYPYWGDYVNWGYYYPYGCLGWNCRMGCNGVADITIMDIMESILIILIILIIISSR